MINKFKIFSIITLFLLTSCNDNNVANYSQEYTSGYVYYRINSEKEGYIYQKQADFDNELLNESKTFFFDLINANFENMQWLRMGFSGVYEYSIIFEYKGGFDLLYISKENLDPSTSVWISDGKGNRIYPTNGYMTYEYYKRMFNLIDKYELLLKNVEWQEYEFHC